MGNAPEILEDANNMMQNNEPKPVIKIFVSHRTDQVSETIDNPLYVNVRCGAVYDKRNPEEYGHMLGDDTGDNISEKSINIPN